MRGARLVDGTIRREIGVHTPFVHRLLRFLEDYGFVGAPRVLGVEGGDEILSHFDDHVPVELMPDKISKVVFSDEGIRSVFVLIRRYHDVSAKSELAGIHEIVCHGDLSPWNTVYDDSGAVAFIDWDNAAPGARHEDVGYATWRYLMLGFAAASPLQVQRRQLRIAAESYGSWDPSLMLDFAAQAQESQRAAVNVAIANGDHRVAELFDLGALEFIEESSRWLTEHRKDLLN